MRPLTSDRPGLGRRPRIRLFEESTGLKAEEVPGYPGLYEMPFQESP